MPPSTFFRRPFCYAALALLAAIASLSGCGNQPSAAEQDQADAPSASTTPSGVTADELLARLTAAYRDAESYVDNAEYHETFLKQGEVKPFSAPSHQVSVAFERPNRFRISRRVPEVTAPALDVTVASDGEQLTATISDLPEQVLQVEAPTASPLDEAAIAPDQTLRQALFPVPLENLYPQLDLLLATEENPPRLLRDAEAKLLADRDLAGKTCHRVELKRADGQYVLWIDPESNTLRRVDAPTDALRKQLDPEGVMLDWRLWIEFRDATLDATLARSIFQPEPPADAKPVERFTPNE